MDFILAFFFIMVQENLVRSYLKFFVSSELFWLVVMVVSVFSNT